jgi:3-hydroxyisobutyrate dehydrogenase/2-hydroxy-3-oxopropionate reductase
LVGNELDGTRVLVAWLCPWARTAGDLGHGADVSHVTCAAMMMRVTTLAVIGIGAMGARFARRFLDGGHDVIVWNRTAEKAAELVELGAAPAASPAEAASRAEVVITVLSDPMALRAVTEGPQGIAAGADASTTVIEMSTVGPDAVRWLASALSSETGLLDAPVLGSLTEAESGSLQVFVGGDEGLADRWIPLLGTLGSPIHVGPLGSGAAIKLAANATLVGTMTLLGETLALADALGVPREMGFRVLAMTPLAAQAERRREPLETGEFPRRFDLSLARKDAELILEEAKEAGVDLRVLEAAAEWFAEAERAGLGDLDYSEVLGWIIGRRG